MGNWNDLLDEIQETGSPHAVVLKKYIANLNTVTGRNVIAYYSGWLQKPAAYSTEINDNDKTGLMTTVHNLDTSKGLDLILHTPGGDLAATESIVYYLRAKFGTNLRAIVPDLAMSAGTMIACACSSILMGKHSSIGPIDPQFFGLPAHGILEEFNQAMKEVKADPSKTALWQTIIGKYNPTLLGECTKAITWSEAIVRDWLQTGMFNGDAQAQAKVDTIIKELGEHSITMSHARHISVKKATDIGLNIVKLEDDPALQDAVLSVHHSLIHTFMGSKASKIIINHLGKAFVQNVNN